MKPKEILVFGASGQIGRHLLRKLSRQNFKITVVTRNLHRKAYILKSQANAGWLNIVELSSFDYEKLNKLFENKDICINLIGILHKQNKNSFKNIHTLLPKQLAILAKKNNLKQFIHVSALGVENASNSEYALSKLNGENEVKKVFDNYVILKPSLVYSVDDNFTTMMMKLLKLLPAFPIYYEGKTVFYPIHVTDMCEIIEKIILNEIIMDTVECIGPEKMTFKEIIEKIIRSLEIRRFLIPMPLFIARQIASFFEIFMKKPLITNDQLNLLKHNNQPSGKYKTNKQLGLNQSLKSFDREINKYSFVWKEGGEFSQKKN